MSSLKKLQIVVYKHVLVSKFISTPIQHFYEMRTKNFEERISVTDENFLKCLMLLYYALRTFQKTKGENQIYLNMFDILEITEIEHTIKDKWQRKKNFR